MSGQVASDDVQVSDVLCACTEPHWWGGECVGAARDSREALSSMLARLHAIRSDPGEQYEVTTGRERAFRVYSIGDVELRVFRESVKAALYGPNVTGSHSDAPECVESREVASGERRPPPAVRATDDDLQALLNRRDLSGLIDALADRMRICACADGDSCDHPNGGRR